jgi:hypothetical protein
MTLGDIVSVRHQGRYYIGRVIGSTSRTATVEFLSAVPAIEGKRRKRRSLPLSLFRAHGRAGVAFVVEAGRR